MHCSTGSQVPACLMKLMAEGRQAGTGDGESCEPSHEAWTSPCIQGDSTERFQAGKQHGQTYVLDLPSPLMVFQSGGSQS